MARTEREYENQQKDFKKKPKHKKMSLTIERSHGSKSSTRSQFIKSLYR